MRCLNLSLPRWRRALTSASQHRLASSAAITSKKKLATFPAIDQKWQARWAQVSKEEREGEKFRMKMKLLEREGKPLKGLKEGKNGGAGVKEKAYILPMFPYPSGTLHLGHLRVYTISDVLARFNEMQGKDVIHPIGWDAFGLPAENAALERGINPEKWTLKNIEAMKAQMKVMGGRWDWDREIMTCDSAFYKHTQAIFLMLYERGLAYQAESLVNYDPVDRTVLANEQVDANGCSWRSGAKVEKIMLKQWFLKIKEFQKPLLEDLETLAKDGNWPERVLAMQKNWIGRSVGTKLWFDIQAKSGDAKETIDVFTTRADTLFGVQYIALSLSHPIVLEAAKEDEELKTFLAKEDQFAPDSKDGFLLKNVTARNPLANVLDGWNQEIPIYVAPYVLSDYGSGAVMGVPGHDTRDHAFWRTNAGDVPVRKVVSADAESEMATTLPGNEADKPMLGKGVVASDIPVFGGLSSAEAVKEIVKQLQKSGAPVEETENWRLRDWLISRQRYWGTPIPIVHCGSCGPVPVPAEQLPIKLPELSDEYFKGKTGNPLAEHPTWKKTSCPKCGSAAERETDTMDTFMDSSWYFFRFISPHLESAPVHPKQASKNMQVDVYIGGVEHAILHLLYARFISKFFASTDLWPSGSRVRGEPFKKLVTQGMVHGKTYSDPATGRFLKPDEVDLSDRKNPLIVATGETPKISYEKMSKSKYNGVDPGDTIATHGADVTRAHMLFQAPVTDVLEWDVTKITGVERWLTRVLRLSTAFFIPPTVLDKFEPPARLDEPLLDMLSRLAHRKVLKVHTQKHSKPIVDVHDKDVLLTALKHEEALLYTKTQQTIRSVTKSYAETISLNTVVSDLMTLTNAIWDAGHTSDTMSYIRWRATVSLLRMLAPIAPATAEEGWEILLRATTTRGVDARHPLCTYEQYHESGKRLPSIFTFPFPEADETAITMLDRRIVCTFSVNGRPKFSAEILKLPAKIVVCENQWRRETETRWWVFERLLETEEGRAWLGQAGEEGQGVKGKLWEIVGTDERDAESAFVPQGCKVIIKKEGAMVNIVLPKSKK